MPCVASGTSLTAFASIPTCTIRHPSREQLQSGCACSSFTSLASGTTAASVTAGPCLAVDHQTSLHIPEHQFSEFAHASVASFSTGASAASISSRLSVHVFHI